MLEARSSWLQSRWFSALAREATYTVEEGSNPAAQFPSESPYDLRLGYAQLGKMVERAQTAGFEIVSQARTSPGFQALLERGLFAIYKEKDRAGLVLLDSHGVSILENLLPRWIHPSFDSVPALVRNALLYIVNRELLSPRSPTLNPAAEWDRLARSVGELGLKSLGLERNVPGASTLATQIEKYRHSMEGRTASFQEKLRQIEQLAMASLVSILSSHQGKIIFRKAGNIPRHGGHTSFYANWSFRLTGHCEAQPVT